MIFLLNYFGCAPTVQCVCVCSSIKYVYIDLVLLFCWLNSISKRWWRWRCSLWNAQRQQPLLFSQPITNVTYSAIYMRTQAHYRLECELHLFACMCNSHCFLKLFFFFTGYARIILAIIAFWFMSTNYVIAGWCYIISALLDAVDGHAARAFNQSKFPTKTSSTSLSSGHQFSTRLTKCDSHRPANRAKTYLNVSSCCSCTLATYVSKIDIVWCDILHILTQRHEPAFHGLG